MSSDQGWVAEAIAEQEEHIKRNTSCMGQIGRAHSWWPSGNPETGAKFNICVTCGVPDRSKDKR